jgi:membrane protease subunit HflC
MSILRNPIPWAVAAIIIGFVLASSLFVVPEYKQALVLRLGKPERIINAYDSRLPFGSSGAGLALKVPFIENVVLIDKRVLDLDMPEQTVLSTDQLRLVVDAFARFRVVNPQKMYQTVGTEDRAAEALARILGSRLRNELGKQPFAALLSPERSAMMDDIQQSVNKQAKQYGAEIVDVRIKRADLPTGAPLDSAFVRMRSARQQEALTIRAQGAKQAQLVRAEADANAAHIYAESFGADPDFYAFYRAMQAYRSTFANGNANVVLSTNNEFLHEFEGRKLSK